MFDAASSRLSFGSMLQLSEEVTRGFDGDLEVVGEQQQVRVFEDVHRQQHFMWLRLQPGEEHLDAESVGARDWPDLPRGLENGP